MSGIHPMHGWVAQQCVTFPLQGPAKPEASRGPSSAFELGRHTPQIQVSVNHARASSMSALAREIGQLGEGRRVSWAALCHCFATSTL